MELWKLAIISYLMNGHVRTILTHKFSNTKRHIIFRCMKLRTMPFSKILWRLNNIFLSAAPLPTLTKYCALLSTHLKQTLLLELVKVEAPRFLVPT